MPRVALNVVPSVAISGLNALGLPSEQYTKVPGLAKAGADEASAPRRTRVMKRRAIDTPYVHERYAKSRKISRLKSLMRRAVLSEAKRAEQTVQKVRKQRPTWADFEQIVSCLPDRAASAPPRPLRSQAQPIGKRIPQ